MAIRTRNQGLAALGVGLLLVTGASLVAQADDCFDCNANCWDRFCSWCSSCNTCRGCHRARSCCRCRRIPTAAFAGSSGYYAANGGYYSGIGSADMRDTKLYSAQGYNVPVAVPLAPCVKYTYNYGWGVPSARLTRVGAYYDQWYPNVPFTQAGGYLPAGENPPVYQPTDTTQQGFYYVHAPHWGRYDRW